ncbi:MAG: hypothetical protein IAB19_07645, partial [Proteobacteria bacterium]|nr:hypothetical protein [Candidatus Avisuccinivibrio stercorigallinarum]
MAVGSLNSTFDYSTMQVIQSAQNKERLQRQQQADKAGTAAPDSAVSAKRTESLKQAQTPVGSVQGQSRQPQQSAAQSQNTARPAADNPSASS